MSGEETKVNLCELQWLPIVPLLNLLKTATQMDEQTIDKYIRRYIYLFYLLPTKPPDPHVTYFTFSICIPYTASSRVQDEKPKVQ